MPALPIPGSTSGKCHPKTPASTRLALPPALFLLGCLDCSQFIPPLRIFVVISRLSGLVTTIYVTFVTSPTTLHRTPITNNSPAPLADIYKLFNDNCQ